MSHRRSTTLVIALLCAVAMLTPIQTGAATPSERTTPKPPQPPKTVQIFTTSNRPDLISGGDARVAIAPRPHLDRAKLRMELNGRAVTKRFEQRPNGRFEAYLTGLKIGRNVVTATAPGFAGRLVITNHPNGGPIFSGPQHQPYVCQASAKDKQCNQPATYSFLYKSTHPLEAGLQPYDVRNPPADVAITTTDTGATVPFVVRREDGFQARDRYSILTLWQPGTPWTRYQPQRQFNHKLLITHGGNCGASYTPGEPPLTDYSGTIPEIAGLRQTYLEALGQGFGVLSTALDNTGHNCNVATEAESLLMGKERFVEQYGDLRYTIGTGCSGGSIAQNTIANAYPGIYQGLLTTCTYPDVISPGAQFADYHLMRAYFDDPSRWAPGVIWTPTQVAAVEGHLSNVNAVASDELLFKDALNPENACPGTRDTVAGDPRTRYDTDTNPRGVRCSVLDIMGNLLGRRPKSVWTPAEQAAGHGFAGLPFANIGIQYGLRPLLRGEITTAQFLDLNARLGGLDIDLNPIPERTLGDIGAITRAYRTGLVNEAQHLDQVAIINFGGPDPGLAHDYAHAFWVEDRMARAQGGRTDNRVMWFGVTPLIGDLGWAVESLNKMDRWLRAVERDPSKRGLAAKIARDRPADVTDRCANVPGLLELPGGDGDGPDAECVLPPSLQLHLSTPREQAGDSVLNDRVACRLRPVRRADYDALLVPLTDAEWTTLQAVFPHGVCDYSAPGRGVQRNQTWLTYGDARGRVVYGGRNLPPVGPRQADGWAAPSFRSLLRQ